MPFGVWFAIPFHLYTLFECIAAVPVLLSQTTSCLLCNNSSRIWMENTYVCVRARRLQLKDLSTVWIAVCLLAFLTHTHTHYVPYLEIICCKNLCLLKFVNPTKNGAIVSCVGQKEQFAKMKFSGRVGQVSIISQKQETLSMYYYLSEHDTSSWFQGRMLSYRIFQVFIHTQINIKL